MTTTPPEPTANDTGRDPDVGQDPMHPHPQDDPRPGADDDGGVGEDSEDSDDSHDGGDGRVTPSEAEQASPGFAATRPMDAPGEVPEPNEPG